MVRRVPLFAYDWAFVALVLVINVIGLVVLHSAVPYQSMFVQQVVWTILGIAICAGFQFFSRRQLLSFAFPLYAVSLVLLVAVLIIGDEVNGAKAWIKLGPIGFQPSEIAKIATVLTLARLLAVRPIVKISDYLVPMVVGIPVLGLVFIEPDLGGTLVLIAAIFGMVFIREMPWKHLIVVGLVVVSLVPTVIWPHLSGYQRERVEILFDLSKDPSGKGYQQLQSIIAIGSGGLLGKGYLNGKQTQLGFVPERQTDFIFSVYSEEFGFAGAISLLILYAALFFRMARMIAQCVRIEDQMIIAGVLSMISFQVLVNIGVTLGLAPVTGLTLPLVSKGGTSLMMVYIGIGLVLLIHRDRYHEA